MSGQRATFGKQQLRSPWVFLFVVVYLLALALTLFGAPSQSFAYIGLSLGMLLLIWLALEITKKIQVQDITVNLPGLELAFACLIFLIFEFVPSPRLEFGGKWSLTTVLRKEILLFALPCLLLRLRGNSPSSMGLSLLNWRQNLKVGAIILICMAIPSMFFVGNTANLIFSGKLSVGYALVGFPVLFIHNIAMSGLPEEFFYRAFIQTRLSQILKSALGGILITSLLFGLVHVPNLMRWYPDMALAEALCRAFFIQGFMGLLMGVLWVRTRNLIPGMIVHSGVNAANNLGSITSLLPL